MFLPTVNRSEPFQPSVPTAPRFSPTAAPRLAVAGMLIVATLPAHAVHLDVEVWGEDNAIHAGFCRTPGAVGCDLTQLTGNLNLPNGTLPVEGASGQMLFLSDFRDFSGGPYKTPNPGFQAVDGALDAGELVNYQAVGVLEYWNPATQAWAPAPAQVRVKLAGAIDPDYVITDYRQCNGQLFCFADGFETQNSVTLFTGNGIEGKSRMIVDATNNAGSLHTHLNFFLENHHGALGGPIGAYLLEMQLSSTRRTQASQPFYVMFNAGLSTADFSAALLARIDTLPPPPPPVQPPIANAGADVSIEVNRSVVLNGTASHDPQPGPSPLSFQWLQTAGSPVSLSDAGMATASFVASQAGQYQFRLTVSDGTASASDDVVVTVNAPEPPPVAPVANAGIDRIGGLNTLVTLDASASHDPEPGPNPLRFAWQQSAGATVGLSNADTATPSFTPTLAGSYAFRVAVDDGQLSAFDEVVINVPELPTANAGLDKLVRLNSSVTLDGSASLDADPGPDELGYHWQQTQGSSILLNGAGNRQASFKPDRPGNYSFKLAVSDGAGTAYDEVTFTVPPLGDTDLDGDIDRIDVALILVAAKKTPIIKDANDIRDLDGNGKIDKTDAKLAKKRCTLRQCRPTRR